MNHQDDRHEIEHLTDSSVVAATRSLSDREILPGQDYSETISHRDNDNSERDNDSGQEELSDNNFSLGDTVVNERVNYISRLVTSSLSRDASVSCLRAPSGNNNLALFLRHLDRKEDRLREELRLEEERREKRLEEGHQQQMKAIQDKFIYKQE